MHGDAIFLVHWPHIEVPVATEILPHFPNYVYPTVCNVLLFLQGIDQAFLENFFIKSSHSVLVIRRGSEICLGQDTRHLERLVDVQFLVKSSINGLHTSYFFLQLLHHWVEETFRAVLLHFEQVFLSDYHF